MTRRRYQGYVDSRGYHRCGALSHADPLALSLQRYLPAQDWMGTIKGSSSLAVARAEATARGRRGGVVAPTASPESAGGPSDAAWTAVSRALGLDEDAMHAAARSVGMPSARTPRDSQRSAMRKRGLSVGFDVDGRGRGRSRSGSGAGSGSDESVRSVGSGEDPMDPNVRGSGSTSPAKRVLPPSPSPSPSPSPGSSEYDDE